MNKKGFTLIELLVVATIMVLLASVAAVAYSQFGKQSRDARRKADLEQIRAAVEMYRSNLDTYPGSLTCGSPLCDPGGCSTAIFLQKIPCDPRSPYVYYYTSTGDDYTVASYLESGGSTCVAGQCGGNCNYCLGPYGQK